MVISSAGSHDICRRTLFKDMDDKSELRVARGAAAGAGVAAGLLGIFSSQLGFVAQVVAFAFGLASASLFPVIFLGIFWKRMNKGGAIAAIPSCPGEAMLAHMVTQQARRLIPMTAQSQQA